LENCPDVEGRSPRWLTGWRAVRGGGSGAWHHWQGRVRTEGFPLMPYTVTTATAPWRPHHHTGRGCPARPRRPAAPGGRRPPGDRTHLQRRVGLAGAVADAPGRARGCRRSRRGRGPGPRRTLAPPGPAHPHPDHPVRLDQHPVNEVPASWPRLFATTERPCHRCPLLDVSPPGPGRFPSRTRPLSVIAPACDR
jgi:hypothetical protein